MQIQPPTSGLAHTIEIAITPVFLLSAVGVFLGEVRLALRWVRQGPFRT